MDENFTRGYCQLRQDTPRTERCPGSLTGDALGIPRDRWSLIYMALVLCGVGFLLPYNSFITAVDFYQARFPMTTIIFDMSLTYICVAFGGVLLNNLVVEAVPLPARVTAGYVLSLATMMMVVLCDVQLRLFSDEVSYRVTLAAVGVIALGCTVQQSSFYGYTSMLPRRYTQAVMTGESAAGLIVSINRIMTKLLLHDARENTIIFFCVSIATVVMCAVVFHVTRRTQFVRYYVGLCEEAGITEDTRGISHHVTNPEEVSLVDILDGNVTRDNYGVLVIQSPSTPPEHEQDEIHGFSNPNYNAAYAPANSAQQEYVEPVSPTTALPLPLPTDVQISKQRHFYRRRSAWSAVKRGVSNRWEVAKTVWPYMISIGLAYFVTLCLFPGIESEVPSCRLLSWMPVILIGIFNLCDFIGKIIASVPYDWPRARLVASALARILIVPFLMMCATPRRDPYLSGEAWSMVLSAVLGITNGYFGSVPMILAPSKVPDEQKELTGNIMTLSYSIGLTGGSAIAYLLDSWLGPMVDDPCSLMNVTTIPYNHTAEHVVTDITTLLNTTTTSTTLATTLLPPPPTTLIPNTTLLSTTISTTVVNTTLRSIFSTVATVASSILGNNTASSILESLYDASTEAR